MITFRTSAVVGDDHRVELTLPPEVPTGRAELVVSVGPLPSTAKRPRTSLADWADSAGEHWGQRLNSADVETFTGRRF